MTDIVKYATNTKWKWATHIAQMKECVWVCVCVCVCVCVRARARVLPVRVCVCQSARCRPRPVGVYMCSARSVCTDARARARICVCVCVCVCVCSNYDLTIFFKDWCETDELLLIVPCAMKICLIVTLYIAESGLCRSSVNCYLRDVMFLNVKAHFSRNPIYCAKGK